MVFVTSRNNNRVVSTAGMKVHNLTQLYPYVKMLLVVKN